ncbi:PH domain-containing protein [Gemella sp. GH3]|nr:PH domain-containing protein [Gemella sp. GH3.1]NYS50949.1 PH domain-containing protein [Gemella sp. GH3]
MIYNSGISVKGIKYIKLENIQNIDTTENIFYKIFGIISLDINGIEETITIGPITTEEANIIINLVNGENKKNSTDNIKFKLKTKDLLFLSLLKNKIFVTYAIIYSFLNNIVDFFYNIFGVKLNLGYECYLNLKNINISLFIIITLIIIIILYAISLIGTFISFKGFELNKYDDNLVCSYGFINKRTIIIPKDKIEKVELKQSLLFRIFGLASLNVTLTTEGIFENTDNVGSNVVIIPIAKKMFINDFISNILQLSVSNNMYILEDCVKKLLKRRYFILNIFLATLVYIGIYFFNYKLFVIETKNIYIIFTLLILFIGIYSVSHYNIFVNNTSYVLGKDLIKICKVKKFSKIEEYIRFDKISKYSIHTNLFLERNNIEHISISTLGSFNQSKIRYVSIEKIKNISNNILTH